jgi:hypothetical protein
MTDSSTLSPSDVEELQRQILECKKLALARKREGDIESAKQALLQSKRLQLQLDEATNTNTDIKASTAVGVTGTETAAGARIAETQPQIPAEPSKTAEEDDAGTNDSGKDDGEGDDDSQLLQQLDDGEHISNESTNNPAAFSLAEMMDLEMIREFALGGFPIPSLEEYQATLETCRRSALLFKQKNKTKEALQQMRCLKQLQTVYKALEPIVGGGEAGAALMGHHDLSDETEEEKALLRELLLADENGQTGSGKFDGDDNIMGGSTSLELDDLIEMDLSEIQDAMTLGMQLPPIESLQKQVNDQKNLAFQLKQSGDLDGAKAALVKFKRWSQHASAIEQLIEHANKTGDPDNAGAKVVSPNDIREEDLEKLLLASDEKTTSSITTQASSKPKPPAQKSSEELRQEAIRLRDEKKLAEATAVLKLYKHALARESEQAEIKERQELVQKLQTEMDSALTQQDRFYFYQRLANTAVGSQQVQAWYRYADLCSKVTALVQTKGSKAVTIATEGKADGQAPAAGSLRLLPDDLKAIIRKATSPTEERVECCILDAMELHTNKAFQTLGQNSKLSKNLPDWIQLETHISIHLPLNETETDKPIDLYFYSKPIERQTFWDSVHDKDNQSLVPVEQWSKRGRIAFATSKDGVDANDPEGSSQYLTLARGDSKFAKTLVRRMGSRKIVIAVHCHAHPGPLTNQQGSSKLKGWFGGGKLKQDPNKDNMEPLNLGKVVLETKELLEQTIVGEYPLLGNGKRQVGGKLRLCIRTGVPFDEDLVDAAENMDCSVGSEALQSEELPLYSGALKFSVTKEAQPPDNDETSAAK